MTRESVRQRLHINRRSPVPRAIQLKSQFEYLIVTGQMGAGEKLPSIREVAAGLGIAPATVVKAYAELERARLIISTGGVGFFVVGAEQNESAAQVRIHQEARKLIEDAVAIGMSAERVLQVVLQEIADRRNSRDRRKVMVLTRHGADAAGLARYIGLALADLYVDLTGLALEDIAADRDAWLPELRKSNVVVVPLMNFKDARAIVDDDDIDLVPMLSVPRDDVRDRVMSLPPNTQVDVIASAPEFLDGLITAVLAWNAGLEIKNSVDMHSRRLRRVLAESDCVVYGSLARDTIEPLLAKHSVAIEFIYVPDDSAIRTLRRLLDDH